MSKKKPSPPPTEPVAIDLDGPGGIGAVEQFQGSVNSDAVNLDIDGTPTPFEAGGSARADPPTPPAKAPPPASVCINRKCRSTEVSETRRTGQRQVIGGRRMACVIKVCAKCRQRRGEWIPAEAINGGR
ncbi:MAG TPA: hypothetical protein VHY37_07325 [Tepidisphaeraceae bacterium]|jgi:hypothetical protein|nr:hypothetical protein [Tepidisphaeraceae bacterium]